MAHQALRWLGFVVIFSMVARVAAADVFPGATWDVRSAEEADLDPTVLAELADLVGGSGMIVRDGYVVYSWGDVTDSADWASAGKPLLSTLLFMATSERRCHLNSAVGDFLAGGSPKDRAITFHHLTNMTSGYGRAEPPGAAWAYNDFAIQLFGFVLCELVFGAPPSRVVEDRLAFLGFEDEVVISDTAYGRIRRMSIRDYARLGQFWLRRGRWGESQVVPENLFNLIDNQVPASLPRTTENSTASSWSLGSYGGGEDLTQIGPGHYGMGFWVNTNGLWPGVPENAFQANGHDGGEICFVAPELDLVAAGIGSWGHPSTEALRLIVAADRRGTAAAPLNGRRRSFEESSRQGRSP